MGYKKYSPIAERGYVLIKYKNMLFGILSALLLSFLLNTESMSDNTKEKNDDVSTAEHVIKSSENLPVEPSVLPDRSLMLVEVVLVDGEESSALILYKNTGEHGLRWGRKYFSKNV